jgi:hypothetical protein
VFAQSHPVRRHRRKSAIYNALPELYKPYFSNPESASAQGHHMSRYEPAHGHFARIKADRAKKRRKLISSS